MARRPPPRRGEADAGQGAPPRRSGNPSRNPPPRRDGEDPGRIPPRTPRPHASGPGQVRPSRVPPAPPRPTQPRPAQPRPAQPVAAPAPHRGGEPRPVGGQGSRPVSPWLYGRHAVAAVLANPRRRCRRVVALADTAAELAGLMAAARAKLPGPAPEILKREVLEALLPEGAVHQGLALEAEPLPPTDLEDLVGAAEGGSLAGASSQIVVLLDQVSDPHNIGAVLRSAAAFGALGVVVPEHGTPAATPALAKAASGALELVPLVRVVNLARALDRLKEAGFWCVGLEGSAERSLAALALTGKVALVLGSEGAGLRRLTRERCDHLARLPTPGALASLNVSNAAAVALYELTRKVEEP